MNPIKPLVAMVLTTAGLFAIYNAFSYALLASLIITALYLLLLVAVPKRRHR